MNKPNFFIIGAPKCGTTALATYLKEHPQIFFSDPKEPHYFNDDFANRHTTSLKTYLNYFNHALDSHLAIGEGSVLYLGSSTAVSNILTFQPKAKFIVMLRNPVEMVYSWHSQAVYSLGEEVSDFESAWQLQENRRRGRELPKYCREPKLLQYGEMCLLGEQLNRLFASVDPNLVKVIFFQDFAADSKKVYEGVLSFLNLESDNRQTFEKINSNKVFKFFLAELLRKRMIAVKQRMGIQIRFGILDFINTINTRVSKRKPLPDAFKEELKAYFADDIQLLSRLTARDLSSWLQ